jgi:hypothetical protein
MPWAPRGSRMRGACYPWQRMRTPSRQSGTAWRPCWYLWCCGRVDQIEGAGLGARAQWIGEQQLLRCCSRLSLPDTAAGSWVVSWHCSCCSSTGSLLQQPNAQSFAVPGGWWRGDRRHETQQLPVADVATPAHPSKHAQTLPFARIIAFRFKGYFSAPN